MEKKRNRLTFAEVAIIETLLSERKPIDISRRIKPKQEFDPQRSQNVCIPNDKYEANLADFVQKM
jgi:hypothetical protein